MYKNRKELANHYFPEYYPRRSHPDGTRLGELGPIWMLQQVCQILESSHLILPSRFFSQSATPPIQASGFPFNSAASTQGLRHPPTLGSSIPDYPDTGMMLMMHRCR